VIDSFRPRKGAEKLIRKLARVFQRANITSHPK
jgi:hypothetical protein